MRLDKTLLLCLSFFTRLPLTRIAPPMDSVPLAKTVWAFPVAGAIIGWLCGSVYGLLQAVGLAAGFCAMFAMGFQWWLTGALHEDGLADTADGFAGGYNKQRRLDIMRDSRIGTFGALALIITVIMRIFALFLLYKPAVVMPALITAAAGSRAMIAIGMAALESARPDGLAAWAGRPSRQQALISVGLACAIATAVMQWQGLELMLIALIACAVMCLVSKRKIGGITGDVYGAIQQAAEVGMLIGAATLLHG